MLTRAFASNPKVWGCDWDKEHQDALESVWDLVAEGKYEEAAAQIPEEHDVIVTRRSLPHDGDWPDLAAFEAVAAKVGRPVSYLVTVRAPVANLVSWAKSRLSAGGDIQEAANLYQQAYKLLFRHILKRSPAFYLVPFEALCHEGWDYVNSLFTMMGLPNVENGEPFETPNLKHYADFRAPQGSESSAA